MPTACPPPPGPWTYVQPPPPAPNGGWFTGERFPADAGWRDFPAQPDAARLVRDTLASADPPPGARSQYPGGFRPGNNAQCMPGVGPFGPRHTMLCTRTEAPERLAPPPPKFAAFAYLS